MHRQTLITTYMASIETREIRAVFIESQGPTADAPPCRPRVRAAKPRTRGVARARRGLLAVLALAVNAIRALLAVIR